MGAGLAHQADPAHRTLRAGGGVDIAARLVGAKLQDILGQPVLVENKPGGGAMIGAEIVAKAPPDGYTLLLTSNSLVNSPTLFGRAPFDWRKDFAFVTTILEQPMVLEVNLDVPAKSVADLVALAKRDGSSSRSARPARARSTILRANGWRRSPAPNGKWCTIRARHPPMRT